MTEVADQAGAPAALPEKPPITPQFEQFEFGGSGSEYFRIWAVNLFLNFITAGLYSPWAKVRREQYFARNTRVANAGFDYHGDPIAIFKGRLVLYALLGIGSIGGPALHAALIVLAIALMPWVVQRSIRFRLRNSSYRNIRFGFDGPVKVFYGFALKSIAALAVLGVIVFNLQLVTAGESGMVIATVLTVAAAPVIYFLSLSALRLYVVRYSLWGNARFDASFGQREGFRLIRAQLLPLLLGAVALGLATVLIGPVVFAVLPVALIAGRAYLQARVHNFAWNGTRLEQHRFHSTLSEARFALANVWLTFLTIITLGLYRPWASVQLAQMKAQAMKIELAGDIDSVTAGAQAGATTAFGQETTDWFDIDISL